MRGARTNMLADLRGSIERIEAHADGLAPARVALGHAEADATLQGGLAVAAVHEVFAEGRQSAAATGFIAGLAGRVGFAGRAGEGDAVAYVHDSFTAHETETGTFARAADEVHPQPAGLQPVGAVEGVDVDVVVRCRKQGAHGHTLG